MSNDKKYPIKAPEYKTIVATVLLLAMLWVLTGCSGTAQMVRAKPYQAGERLFTHLKSGKADDRFMDELYESRTWVPFRELTIDPIELGKNAKIPIQNEKIKLLGPAQEDALRSLALKIWLIEHAEHTVDVVYYIFKTDLAGEAVLGALCNAVQRGVDVRFMVDSIGSISLANRKMMALESCAQNAGYLRDENGQPTKNKARVQTVIFNSLTNSLGWINRRSHDKLLVVDGAFPEKTTVITGGRNISLDYYGIRDDGSEDPTAYRDLEIVLRHGFGAGASHLTVGNISEMYYSLLFLYKGNKRVRPVYPEYNEDYVFFSNEPYIGDRKKAQESLAKLKSYPKIARQLKDMPEYMRTGFYRSKVRLAHELANLTNRNVVTKTNSNLAHNPNSIISLIAEFGEDLDKEARLRLVSPYLFMAKYYDSKGNVVTDNVGDIHKWLAEHPGGRLEVITNSVLTSDNFFAQSIIDMELGPRLLLSAELKKAWLSGLRSGEMDQTLTKSDEWKKQINNPQIFIYQTGKLDAQLLGHGDAHYGKLHAKFIVDGNGGFVGTSNFDYRSRLFNNEMGFFYENRKVDTILDSFFEALKATSYRWGTPEWLQMRKEVMQVRGLKGWSTRNQRGIYKFMRATGLDWLI